MSDVFYDRRGREKYADDLIPVCQKGYFAILVKDGKVLVTYPPSVSVPEFPGGAVSRKEDFRNCSIANYMKKPELNLSLATANALTANTSITLPTMPAPMENIASMNKLLLSMTRHPMASTRKYPPGKHRKTARPPG